MESGRTTVASRSRALPGGVDRPDVAEALGLAELVGSGGFVAVDLLPHSLILRTFAVGAIDTISLDNVETIRTRLFGLSSISLPGAVMNAAGATDLIDKTTYLDVGRGKLEVGWPIRTIRQALGLIP